MAKIKPLVEFSKLARQYTSDIGMGHAMSQKPFFKTQNHLPRIKIAHRLPSAASKRTGQPSGRSPVSINILSKSKSMNQFGAVKLSMVSQLPSKEPEVVSEDVSFELSPEKQGGNELPPRVPVNNRSLVP